MDKLIEKLVNEKFLKTPEVIEAFYKIKRQDFLPAEIVDQESFDIPLPIGHDQTISQPYTVAFMLEALKLKKGQKALDIGSGSGWSTALLAEIVGPKGKVFGIERIKELKEFGEKNAAKYNFNNVTFIHGDGTKGLPNKAPFDRIMVSAAAFRIPKALKEQLAIGGRMIIPTEAQDLRIIERVSDKNFSEVIHQGFLFVPLVEGELK